MKRLRNRQVRASRIMLAATGLVLLALSSLARLLSTGAVDRYGSRLDSDTVVLNDDALRFFDAHRLGLQGIVFAGGVMAAALGVRWLLHQIPPIRHQEDNEFANPDSDLPGSNTVAGGALAHALEADLERSDAVTRARAEFRTGDNVLRLRLDVDEKANVDTLLDAVVTPAIERITHVAELGAALVVQIDLRPLSVTPSRVR